jgi:hypothetical protein
MGNSANIVIGLLAALLGGVLIGLIIPAQTTPAVFASVPSSFYPDFTSWLLVASGLALAGSGILSPRQRIDVADTMQRTKYFGVALAALVLLTSLMPVLGYRVAGVLGVAVTMLIMGERRPVPIAAASVTIAVLIWFVFEILLGRPLP